MKPPRLMNVPQDDERDAGVSIDLLAARADTWPATRRSVLSTESAWLKQLLKKVPSSPHTTETPLYRAILNTWFIKLTFIVLCWEGGLCVRTCHPIPEQPTFFIAADHAVPVEPAEVPVRAEPEVVFRPL